MRSSSASVTSRGLDEVRVTSRAPIRFDPRDLGFAVGSFAEEFGLRLTNEVEVNLDLGMKFSIV
jgi:hypothetical protein